MKDGQLLKINILDLSIMEDIKICSNTQFPMLCVGNYFLVCDDHFNIIVSKHDRIIRKIHVNAVIGYLCPYGDDKFIYTSYYHNIIECITLEGHSVF